MQKTNVDSTENPCENMYSESCINNCIQWILEARINAKNEHLNYVIIFFPMKI